LERKSASARGKGGVGRVVHLQEERSRGVKKSPSGRRGEGVKKDSWEENLSKKTPRRRRKIAQRVPEWAPGLKKAGKKRRGAEKIKLPRV